MSGGASARVFVGGASSTVIVMSASDAHYHYHNHNHIMHRCLSCLTPPPPGSGGGDVYATLNLLMRRSAKENNFKVGTRY